MKRNMQQKISILSIVALAVLISVPASLMAQDRVEQDPFRDMVTTVTNTNVHMENLAAQEDFHADRIRYVDVNELLTDENRTEFDETLQRHDADLRSMRDAVHRNETFAMTLQTNRVNVDDLVGVNVGDDGWMTVYHRPLR